MSYERFMLFQIWTSLVLYEMFHWHFYAGFLFYCPKDIKHLFQEIFQRAYL